MPDEDQLDTAAPDADATVASPESQEESKESESESSTEKSKPENRVKSRIDELTRYRREAERDRDYWREQAMKIPAPQAETPEPKMKTLEDFEFDQGAFQAYLFEKAEERAVKAAENRIKERADQEAKTRRRSDFERHESAFSQSVDDYYEVTRDPRVPITVSMAEALADSDEGPAVAYFLAKNLGVAEGIAQLSPLAQVRELGRIEERLVNERAKASGKASSKAPPPTPKLNAGDASGSLKTTDASGDAMSDDDWFRAEKKRVSKRKS